MSSGKSWSSSRRKTLASTSSILPNYTRHRHASQNAYGFKFVGGLALVAGVVSAVVMARCEGGQPAGQDPDTLTTSTEQTTTSSSPPPSPSRSPSQLRTKSFPLDHHSHGKTRVRVMKVVQNKETNQHDVYEFNVTTTLLYDGYDKVFTKEDNTDLVATDTQKNTVYVVAKRCTFDSPEGLGMLLCQHFLAQYPFLQQVEVKVDQVIWQRAIVHGEPHRHAFCQSTPETYGATVSWDRASSTGGPTIASTVRNMTVLKTTQSGFEGYLKDQYTLLPPTRERCLATQLDATWTCQGSDVDHRTLREQIRSILQEAIFGPPDTGIYSPSLQATIYDGACMVLSSLPQVESITIHTPNLHYLPAKLLDAVGETFEDDIFIPTSEPSGIITCTVVRERKSNKE